MNAVAAYFMSLNTAESEGNMAEDAAGASKRLRMDDNKKVVLAEPKITGSTVIGETRWLKMSTLTYQDRYGAERKWDYVARTTKKPEAYADAVVILTILKGRDLTEPNILLVKQWRPALAVHTIEMPAGLIDEGESPEEAAIRELKEECGYIGTASHKSPGLTLSPGLSNESAAIVHLNIDLNDPKNKKPEQELDDGEDIEVLKVPLSQLRAKLNELHEDGCQIFFGLYCFALAHNAFHEFK